MSAYNIIRNIGEENVQILYNAGIITDANIKSLQIYARYEALIQEHTLMETYAQLAAEFQASISNIRKIINKLR